MSKDGPDSRFPYYHVDLNSDLHVQPNDQISIHIEYEGRIRDVSHNMLAGGQQVDVVLPRADTPEDYTFQETLGSQGEGKDLRMPVGVAADRTGSIYVADYETFSVQVFNSDGLFLRRWGTRGTKPGQLGPMGGIVLDEQVMCTSLMATSRSSVALVLCLMSGALDPILARMVCLTMQQRLVRNCPNLGSFSGRECPLASRGCCG